jgi:D-methionine transport system ATP-binding protein
MTTNQPVVIRLENLSKTYKSKAGDVHALNDINIEIHQGEIFGVIGLSGAGKSTLVRCINYLERPTGGKVFVNGQEMGKLNNAELNKARQSIGMIFQQFNLLMQKTTVENICFPLEIAKVPAAQAKQRALELLELVGLSDKSKAYPAQLSGGQKQRVAIARALATNPKVLLCDEATSALDPASTRSILTLLKDINAKLGITIVIITHEMSVIEEICQRVAIIDKSRIAESGYVRDIFARPQSSIARTMVFPNHANVKDMRNKHCCRIAFDGQSSFEPVIAGMILEFKQPVNIIFANTQNIGGKAFGQIVLQMPEDEHIAAKMEQYLQIKGLSVEAFEADDTLEVRG